MTARPGAATYFGGRTTLYDSHYDAANADGHSLRARLAVALRLLGGGPGTALDAGMGPGRLCAELATLGWTVSGIDASAEMVDAARLRLPDAADRLLRAEIEQLPFEDESFDRVAATGVLEYADVPRALAELARVSGRTASPLSAIRIPKRSTGSGRAASGTASSVSSSGSCDVRSIGSPAAAARSRRSASWLPSRERDSAWKRLSTRATSPC